MTQEERINKYAALQQQIEALKEEQDTLRLDIISDMEATGEVSFTTAEGITAKLVDKTNFKYVDELSMIKYLKENGYAMFIKEAINSSSMNSELKKSTKLAEDLSSYYQKNQVKALTVK